VFYGVDATNVAHYNEIYGNSPYDLGNSNTGVTVDATKNWWGQATGPAAGKISGSVNTTPWYATATTTPETEKVTVKRGETVVAYSDTIQGAIDAASAGDTVNVAAGTYNENLVISKQLTLNGAQHGVTAVGRTGDESIINAANPSVYVVEITAGGVTLDGFTITGMANAGENQAAVITQGVDNCVITNNILTDNYKDAINLFSTGGNYSDSNTVSNNVINGPAGYATFGIKIKGSHNTISGNKVYNTDTPIHIWSYDASETASPDYNVISGNTIGKGAGTAAYKWGVNIKTGHYNTVTNNTITDAEFAAIYLYTSDRMQTEGDFDPRPANNTISGNTISGGEVGIALMEGARNNTISGNNISGTSVAGILGSLSRWPGDFSTDPSSRLVGTPQEYLQITNNSIEDNTISNCGHGIAMEYADNNTLTGNTIQNNTSVAEIGWHGVAFAADAAGVYFDANSSSNIAHFNNIAGNTGGLKNANTTVTLDATNNWWGSPNGQGQDEANGVSANVDYSPWLPGIWETYYDETGAEIDTDGDDFSDLQEYWLGTNANDPTSLPGAAVKEVETGYVPANTSLTDVAVIEEVAAVDVATNANGAASVTLAEYAGPPAEKPVFGAELGYVDVHTSDQGNLTSVTVKINYTEDAGNPGYVNGVPESSLMMYYWNTVANDWQPCNNQGVDTSGNFIWATISADTIPNLSYLSGGPFGGGSPSVDIEEGWYKTGDTVNVTVEDSNANQRPFVIETISVTMSSTLPDSLAITLTETDVNTGVFEGSVVLQSPSEGNSTKLAVADGNTITATYDFGDSSITDTAMVDDTAPTITGLTPVNDSFVNDSTPDISATLSDAGSGIDTSTVLIKVD
jgi:parallel beta-helix repeat protein